MEVGARPRSILDQTIGGRSTDPFFFIQYNRVKDRTVPYRDKLSTDPRRAGHTSSALLVAGTEQQGKTRPTGPGLEGELSLFKREWEVSRKASVSVLGLGSKPLDLFRS